MPGIFCLEGPWDTRLTDRATVRPMLELLDHVSSMPHLYDRVHTRAELEYLLAKWGQKGYADYPIGYFAFHGEPGKLHLAKEKVALNDLGDKLNGKLAGRFVHFGSCSVMRTSDADLQAFRAATGARAVMGYRKNVDWMQSAAFELLLFDAFTQRQQARGIETWVRDRAGGLADKLGFTMLR